MLVKLDERLMAAANLVLSGYPAADIGTDHNYLPVFLVQNGICPLVISSDKARMPYLNAAAMTRRLCLTDKINVRWGEGLEVLNPGEVATIIITGMGGRLICNILEASPQILLTTTRLVLQPQKDAPLLRRWLAEHNWRIVAEKLAFDNGFYYPVLAVEQGQMVLSREEELWGPCLLAERPALFEQYLRFQLAELGQLIDRLEQCDGLAAVSRKQQLIAEREFMAKILAQKPSTEE